MRYTLWQRGLLIGETDFGLGKLPGGSRAGVFHPAPSGMSLLPALTAMAPALLGLGEAMKRLPLSDAEIERDADAAFDALAGSAEGQRVLRAAEQLAELELRDPTGRPVGFESLLVSDLEELFAIGASVEGTDGLHREHGDPVRYVISANLSERRSAYDRGHPAH